MLVVLQTQSYNLTTKLNNKIMHDPIIGKNSRSSVNARQVLK